MRTAIAALENERIVRARKKFGAKFLSKVFTDKELEYSLKRVNWSQNLSARFAAKCAFFRVINCYNKRVYTDVWIEHDTMGAPVIRINDQLNEMLAECGVTNMYVSLTHSKTLSIANIICE